LLILQDFADYNMFWTKLARFILKNRIVILIGILGLTGFMAYQIQFLKLDYGYAGLLPDTHPVALQLEEFEKVFGEDATIVLIGVEDHDFYQLDKFRDWQKMKKNIEGVDGVLEVQTISSAVQIIKDQANRQFNIEPIFPEYIPDQSSLDSLLNVFFSLPIYEGMLHADSGNVITMALTMDSEAINDKSREKIVEEIEGFAFEFGDKFDVDMHFSGLPFVRTKLAIMIKDELLKFIFLAAAVLAVVLLIFFRSILATFFSVFVVLLGVFCALGMIVLLDYKITILTGMIPAVIIVIGIPNCVFLLNKYHQEYTKHGNKIKALQRSIEKVGNAIFLTNLTTAVGFATFMIIQHRILSRFGQVASLNILLLFVISVTLIPIIFSFLPPPTKRQTKHLDKKWIGKVVNLFAWAVQYRRKSIYVIIFLLLVFAGFGITKMKSTGFIVDDIPKDHPVYVDLKFFEKHFVGVMPLEMAIDTRKPNGALQGRNLKQVQRFQEKLETYPELTKPSSLIDGLMFARQAYFNGNPKQYRLPSNQERSFILSYLKGGSEENQLISSFVDSSFQKLRVNVRVEDIGTYGMLALQDSLQKDLNHFFPPDKYDTMLTGSSLTFTLGTSYLVKNLFWSLGLAILLISLFMASMFKSFKMVLISVFPNILPLLFTAGLMGFGNIPIKPSTVLVFSVAFGISVDTAIHFLAKYRQELMCKGATQQQAVLNSIQEVGVSIIYTVIILFLGFGVFIASDFGGTVAMGILTAITLFVAVFSNLLLVPSILMGKNKRIKKKHENN